MEFKLIKKETKFEGRAFSVARHHLETTDGRQIYYDIVQHPGAVTLVPVDEDGRIWFVRQYRYGAGKDLLELPAGTLEHGEDPLVCAAREVREEIGMAARELARLGTFFLAPGYSTEFMHVFLATGLYEDPLTGDEDEFLKVEAIPAAEAYRMAESGEIQDGKSLAALFMAVPQFKKYL